MLKYSQQGFTLIELAIVVLIIGILVMVAFPSYQNSIIKSRRAEAKTALVALAQYQESYFVEHGNRYASTLAGSGGLLEKSQFGFNVDGDKVYSENKYYTLSVADGAGTRFQLVAVPTEPPISGQASGEKKLGGECFTFTLGSDGQKGIITGDGVKITDKNKIKNCW